MATWEGFLRLVTELGKRSNGATGDHFCGVHGQTGPVHCLFPLCPRLVPLFRALTCVCLGGYTQARIVRLVALCAMCACDEQRPDAWCCDLPFNDVDDSKVFACVNAVDVFAASISVEHHT